MTQEFESLKNLHFNGLLLTKVYNVWAKKYRGVMFYGIEYWCKIWRKTDLCFEKWIWNLSMHLSNNSMSGVLIKNKGSVGLFQILQKERLFHLLWQPWAVGGNLTMWLHLLPPSVWSRREYIWTLIWKWSLVVCFENWQDVPYSHE